MPRRDSFDYIDDDGEPHSLESSNAGVGDEKKRQVARLQAIMSHNFGSPVLYRNDEGRGQAAQNDKSDDSDLDESADPPSRRVASTGGFLGGLMRQMSKSTALLPRASRASSAVPPQGLEGIRTVAGGDTGQRALVRAILSQRNASAAPPPEPMAAPEKPVVTFTIWLMGNKQSGRRTLMAGLLHHLRKRVGVDSNDIIVRHVVANIQDELPPASALSSRTSLLVVLFDVCERGALEGVLRLPCRPAHRPLLVANGIDCEYWRVVQVSHAENVALLQGYDYVEVSALTGLHMGQLLDAIDRRLQLVRALRLLDADLPLELDVERLSDDGSSGSSEGDESDSAITGSSAYSTASEGGETLEDDVGQQQGASPFDLDEAMQRYSASPSLGASPPPICTTAPSSPTPSHKSTTKHCSLSRPSSPRPLSPRLMSTPPPALMGSSPKASADTAECGRCPTKEEAVESGCAVSKGFCSGHGKVEPATTWRGDTDYVLQMLAKVVCRLLPSPGQVTAKMGGLSWRSQVLLLLYWPLGALMAHAATLFSSLFLLFPTFFSLAILRQPENPSPLQRARLSKLSSNARLLASASRWARCLVRALPLAIYVLLLPYLLIYYWLPYATMAEQEATLIGYTTVMVVLQYVATARALRTYRKRSRKYTIPPVPKAAPQEPQAPRREGDRLQKLVDLLFGPASDSDDSVLLTPLTLSDAHEGSPGSVVYTLPPRPPVPGTLVLSSPTTILLLACLLLETCQLGAFALWHDPNATHLHSALSDSRDPFAGLGGFSWFQSLSGGDRTGTRTVFWGERLFNVLFLSFVSNLRLVVSWAAVAAVAILVVVLVSQLTSDVRGYGLRLKDNPDKARTWFHKSLTGSLLFGRESPQGVRRYGRLCALVLSDGLFLLISLQLLQALSCKRTASGVMVLFADEATVCWRGGHQALAYCSLVAYALFQLLSVFVTPLLMAAKGEDNGEARFVRLHVMLGCTLKSALLIMACLGPHTALCTGIATLLCCATLLAFTVPWFTRFVPKHYSQDLEPCNVALGSIWKAASYTGAITTALVVLAAHILGFSRFPRALLFPVLALSWITLIAVFLSYYMRWRWASATRYAVIEELIDMPFRYQASISQPRLDGPLDMEETGVEDSYHQKSEALPCVGDYDWLNRHGPPPSIPGYSCCPLCQHRESMQGLVGSALM